MQFRQVASSLTSACLIYATPLVLKNLLFFIWKTTYSSKPRSSTSSSVRPYGTSSFKLPWYLILILLYSHSILQWHHFPHPLSPSAQHMLSPSAQHMLPPSEGSPQSVGGPQVRSSVPRQKGPCFGDGPEPKSWLRQYWQLVFLP